MLWFIWKEEEKIKIMRIACMTHLFIPVQMICLFSPQVKINHDSHEFILEFGTVVNKLGQLRLFYDNFFKYNF
jgi:hypothetical protein